MPTSLAEKIGEVIPKTTRLACVVDFWLKPFEGLFDQFNNCSKYENLDLLLKKLYRFHKYLISCLQNKTVFSKSL